MARLWIIWVLLLGSAMGAAQTAGAAKAAPSDCPWLTQGSAARVLGGEVIQTVAVTGANEGSCTFSRPPETLAIMVSAKALPPCPEGSAALKGIGNEAARCSHPAEKGQAGKGQVVETISSRVRESYFTVTLTWRGRKGGPQDDALEQVAEQVAGNLY